MIREIWKDIPGYDGLYQVSNTGRVKSLARRVKRGFCCVWVDEQIMTIHNCKSKGYGYYAQVTLFKNGKQRSFRIHRLVAMAFVERVPGCDQVDHINGNKLDNRADNLRWVTQSENTNNPITKSRSKKLVKVNCYSLDGSFIKSYSSLTNASRDLGVPISSISQILNKKKGMNGNIVGYTFTRV